MKHLDLFSGIGGFAYAADQIWDNVEHIFCDNDPFCQQVIKKHWPNSPIYGDIRQLTTNPTSIGRKPGRSNRKERHLLHNEDGYAEENQQERKGRFSWSGSLDEIDLLTGGFPCQPFSVAGRKKGTADDRHLWPEMLRVIRETKPTWVIAENVRGLLTIEQGMVFEQVCLDLEAEGYDVQPLIIPACAVQAPHRRDRVWFIANNRRKRWESGSNKGVRPEVIQSERQNVGFKDWERNWYEVATELCSLDDGLPARLGETTISASRHRKEQLKMYGNSIVPQIAIEIMRSFNPHKKD